MQHGLVYSTTKLLYWLVTQVTCVGSQDMAGWYIAWHAWVPTHVYFTVQLRGRLYYEERERSAGFCGVNMQLIQRYIYNACRPWQEMDNPNGGMHKN